MFGLLVCIGVSLLGLYLYFFFGRSCVTFGLPARKWYTRLISAALALFFAVAAYLSDLWFTVALYLAMFGVLLQLIDLLLRLIAHRPLSAWKKLFGSGVPALIAAVVAVVCGYINFQTVVQTQYTVCTQKSIRDEGYRIVFVSDVHFSEELVGQQRLQEVCQRIAATHPDILVLGGDIFDNETDFAGMQTVLKEFGNIPTAYGIYYIYGNHDRPMHRLAHAFTDQQLQQQLQQNGITRLRDETVEINGELVLIGREDRSVEGRADASALLQGIDPQKLLIMLDHRPTEYAQNDALGIDLILSGHTHGGQLFPLNLIMQVIPFNDAVYGHDTLEGGMQTIVSSGLAGWGFPVKTAAPCEYVVVDVVAQ